MNKTSWLLVTALSAGAFTGALAQKTAIYNYDLKAFNKAVELYKEKQFLSAQIIFENEGQNNLYPDLKADCNFYIAQCAMHLNQSDAGRLMEDFIANYPTSTKKNQAYVAMAHNSFAQGRYPDALKWFEQVDENQLTTEEKDQFNFQKGYSFFVANNKKEAAEYFNKAVNSKVYGSQAKYYLGYMAYENDDFKEASKQFEQVSGEEKYKEKMSYFQADMNFKMGNFQKAIDLGLVALMHSDAEEKSELNKIIGESYFNLKQYDKAIPYLAEYKGQKGKWNNTDYYLLGYAYYKQGDYENAISQFNKIIEGKDAVAQNAYYHLGESYLKTNRKQQALNAFKNASEMNYDLKIQEDAFLNYAKLSYEIGNSYQAVPDVLQAFMEKYPENPNKEELQGLLVNSFITSKNYKGALELLEKNKNAANNTVYQKVTFYRGLELYTDGNYQDALALFKKAIAQPRDEKVTARATFWLGETQYVLDNFGESLLSFKQFAESDQAKNTPEFKNVNYNLAYAYFKLKEYDQAAAQFQTFVTTVKDDKVRLTDAYLRLGDSYFVSAKYWPAMDAYNKAIELKSVDADYAAYQKAISYGFVDKDDKKIEDLNKFLALYSKSRYRDDVLFELANTYVEAKKNDLAIATYDKIVAENKNGTYTTKSLLKQGLIYYNTDKDQLALAKFKKLAADYPSSPEALEGVATARLIYVDNGNVDEYAAWVKTLNFVQVSDVELDNDTYEAAEKQYLQNNVKQAISGFTGYIAKFPNGAHALNANFYLAQLYFADGLENNAIPNYEFVISKPKSEFTEQALARLAQIYLKTPNYDKAIPVLKRLETEADYPQNVTFAQANLMKSYYEKEDFAGAVTSAEKVLANPKMDDKVKSDAQIIVARSAIKVNDEAKARVAYAKLLSIAKGELAAEALYYDAYFKNKDGKFEASNKTVQKLAKDYSGYKYFGAKGLVVMAKNFYGLKDAFQANYILDSVIKNFSDFQDVIDEAKAEQEIIKGQEAKTNSSVTQ